MQKFITTIIACGIIYLIIEKNFTSSNTPNIPLQTPKQETSANTEFQGNFIERGLSNIISNIIKTEDGKILLESIIKPVNSMVSGKGDDFPTSGEHFINSMFKIKTSDNLHSNTKHDTASCGHRVKVSYKISNMKNKILEENTKIFNIGSGAIAPGLDAVIVGMKIGQKRDAVINNKYIPETRSDKSDLFKLSVSLQEIYSENFADETIKIFDDLISYKVPLFCSNKIAYHAKITQLSNNKVIFNSKDSNEKIKMILGDRNYPMIFSHGIHNKIPVGTRTIISKGSFFKSENSEFSTIFPDKKLPENELFMIEFSNFSHLDENKL